MSGTPTIKGRPPLLISVNRSAAVDPVLEPNSKEFRSKRQKIIRAGKNMCAYCGFKAEKYLQVHHVNGDHEDCRDQNLVPACPLCHRVFHLEVVAGNKEAAEIVYLPEVSQAELNTLTYACMAWMAYGGKFAEIGEDLMGSIENRGETAREYLDTIDRSPIRLAEFLQEAPDKIYKSRYSFLKHVRLFVKRADVLSQELPWWKDNVFCLTPPTTLPAITKKYLPKGQVLRLPGNKRIKA